MLLKGFNPQWEFQLTSLETDVGMVSDTNSVSLGFVETMDRLGKEK